MAKVSVKHVQIDKSQSTMLAVIALAVVVVIFSLFATKAMVVKGMYQRRALHARRQVATDLKSNLSAAQTLFTQYKVFADQDPNILGGTVAGNSSLDGDNARIVLDALPSNYDAPALATSVEKILNGQTVSIGSISLTDDPTTNSDFPESNPKIKPIDFSFSGGTTYKAGDLLLKDFERSIRPFDVKTIEISGSDNNLKLTLDMTTYYQPAKSLDLKATKEIK